MPEAQPIAQAELANIDPANVDSAKVAESPAPPAEARAPLRRRPPRQIAGPVPQHAAPATARSAQPTQAGARRPRAIGRRRRRLVRLRLCGRSAASPSRPTTPMCRPTTPRSPPRSPATSRSVPVTDNTHVHAGDVIATIDDGDYRLAADSAREKVATQQATVARIGASDRRPGGGGRRKPSRSSSPRKPPPTRMQLELDRQNALVAQRFRRATRRWNRRKLIATRPSPACKARKPRSIRPPPMSRCSRDSSRKRSRRSTSSRPRWPRPSAICPSPSSARRSTA